VILLRFRREQGRWPHLLRPRAFSDLIQRRKLFDANPLFTTFTDKVAVRAFVRDKVGDDVLIPRLWEGNDPAQLPFDDLAYPVVVKPSHLSGWVRFLKAPPAGEERATLLHDLRHAMTRRHTGVAEPAYYGVPPRILVEPMLSDGEGRAASDFKIWVFHHRTAFIQFVVDRFNNHQRGFYDRDWRRLASTSGSPRR